MSGSLNLSDSSQPPGFPELGVIDTLTASRRIPGRCTPVSGRRSETGSRSRTSRCPPATCSTTSRLAIHPRLSLRPSTRRYARWTDMALHFANTRGSEKIMYAGYYPMGLSLERIFTEMPAVPFKDHVWPRFLRDNAAAVLKIGGSR